MSLPSIFKDPRIGALCAGNFMVGTSMYIVGGLLSDLALAFKVSIAKAGLLIAAFAITSVIASPLFATLSAKIDRRRLLTAMLLICALANGLAYFAQTYEQLLATRVLAAIASAVFTPQAAAVLGLLVTPAQRTQATSAVMVGWALASVLGVPLGVWIGHAAGWRVAMGSLGGASLIVAFCLWRLLPPMTLPPINLHSWLTVLRTPALSLLIATSAIFAAGSHAVFSYIAPLITTLQPGDPTLLSRLLLAHGLAAVLSNVLVIVLIDRLGLEKMVRIWVLLPIAVFTVWPLLSHSVLALFVMQMFWAIGAAGFSGLQQARLAALAPALASASIALNSSAFYLGQSSGTLLGGAAWSLMDPRYLPWLGLSMLIPAALISRKGRHAAKRLRKEGLSIPPTL
ncbi:putative MFS family arabinose efflux permease [Panacagrimonas perspica]|uniref:Putative MFS family arabinose efflux permease n=1 Tax=Panacagrimonas perspica TaxID=381431 RepID=A0A4R7NRF5_9GAMM|nr:MFS transporter [Panacagrimonas perspica]TDU23219.1 putative MFS family arabinose efflux permease [Panacagrimonas perspica]